MTSARSTSRRLAVLALVAAPLLTGVSASPVMAGTPTCFGKRATIVGDGYVLGTRGHDVIVASPGSEVHAEGGHDRVCGAGLVYGGPGRDRIYYAGPGGGDVELRGQAGADRVVSPASFAFLYGGRGSDVVIGGPGEQWLLGERGHDRSHGGPGPDHVYGGAGRDRADGGPGDDVCDAERRVSCHR